MKRLLPLFLSLFLLAGCSGADTPVTQQLFAMNTTMTLTLYGSRASDAALSAQQAINRLDGLWSRTKASSDVSRLNAAAGDPAPETEVAPETGALLSRARELGALTGGALDITIAPIMDAWGFGTTSVFQESDFRVPSRTELDALLPLVDSGRLHVSGSAEAPLAWLDGPGMAVDLGAVAKGRAADLLVPLLTDSGVTSRRWARGPTARPGASASRTPATPKPTFVSSPFPIRPAPPPAAMSGSSRWMGPPITIFLIPPPAIRPKAVCSL